MSKTLNLIFTGFYIMASGSAKCPKDIPIMHPTKNDTYLCAVSYPASTYLYINVV